MNKPLAHTPPMGWNSWNTFSWNINADLIRTSADYMVSTGLKDAGYEYIVIDDCWSEKQRVNGRLVPDKDKFPDGIKPVADYVHSKGLKFGMYSCAGTHTCAGYPGSFEHEFDDAETFAEWGVDYLKYDYCYKPSAADGANLYKRMGMALRNCGRDIVFSACNSLFCTFNLFISSFTTISAFLKPDNPKILLALLFNILSQQILTSFKFAS